MSDEPDRGRNAAAILVDAHIAATNGNRRALIYRDKTYSFHDLAALMNRAGNMLRAAGVERGDHVMILLSPSPALFGVMLGAIKIGAVAIVAGEAPNTASVRAACSRYAPAVAIIDSTLLNDLRTALDTTKLIVAGDSRDDLPALPDLLRAAPSSLAAEPVDDAAPAVVVMTGDGTVSASHADLVPGAAGPSARVLRLDSLDLSAALALLASCNEVGIPVH